jgi:hypothetical protein
VRSIGDGVLGGVVPRRVVFAALHHDLVTATLVSQKELHEM